MYLIFVMVSSYLQSDEAYTQMTFSEYFLFTSSFQTNPIKQKDSALKTSDNSCMNFNLIICQPFIIIPWVTLTLPLFMDFL